MQETLPPYAAFRKALAAGAKASNDDAAMPAPETSQGRAGPHPPLPYWELRVIPMMALFRNKPLEPLRAAGAAYVAPRGKKEVSRCLTSRDV